ncbi:MAG: cobalamin-binding protein [Rhodocyclaceae bacterium]|nr:cobalamin-binding protein [Rhodocyclaceae bacterium]
MAGAYNGFRLAPFSAFSLRLCASAVGVLISLSTHAEVSVRDDVGNTVTLAQPARRIVSLAPHMTETLFAAGAGAHIIGTVEYSDHPEAAKKIPRVGGYSRLDLEAVAALKPDLLVGWQSGNAAAHLDKLKGLGYTMYVSQPNRIEDVASEIERLGVLAGTDAVAAAEAKRLRERLAALRAQYSGKSPVRTFYQIWKQPLMTVGRNQIITDAIRLCGGENVFGALEQMAATVTVEAVIAANPEVIVASGMGDSRPEWLDDWKRWTSMEAVKRDNLFFVPPELIQRHTPRFLDGTERLCRHLETVRQRRGY